MIDVIPKAIAHPEELERWVWLLVKKISAAISNKIADRITAVQTATRGKNWASNIQIRERPNEMPNPINEYLINRL